MKHMTNDEMAEMIAERNGNQRFCKNCDDCCQPYNSADDCFKSAMEMAKWKDDYYYKVITEIVDAAYNSCEDHSKIDEVLKKYKL